MTVELTKEQADLLRKFLYENIADLRKLSKKKELGDILTDNAKKKLKIAEQVYDILLRQNEPEIA